ncbi:MAG: NAD(+) kinase [Gammaproteobacteria bacterium]|nr:NAD(+) kinase [Gammaproteobacteria bacterium]
MKLSFKRVGLIGKSNDRNVLVTLRALIDFLERRKAKIVLDTGIADMFADSGYKIVDRASLARQCNLAIVVGGDGTLLNAARSLAEPNVAVLGVNLGRLGFLVDVSPEDMAVQLEQIFGGNFTEEQRTLLHATVASNGEPVDDSTALNDVIIHKKDIARMIELDTWIDGHFLNSNRSDGLIVATPTGSTAYALSGGGPVLHPALNALTLVPICPHTLSNRPIVINDESVIEIVIHKGTLQAQISCDGQVNVILNPGDRITVRKHEHTLRLIHPPDYEYFDILRKKLRWSEQP